MAKTAGVDAQIVDMSEPADFSRQGVVPKDEAQRIRGQPTIMKRCKALRLMPPFKSVSRWSSESR
jgi:hypothetical protein